MLVFTSCTNNYIPKARILGSTVKIYHPDWTFCLVLCEDPPYGFDLSNEPFDRLLSIKELEIPNFENWLFRHRVVEICTASKGPALYHFLERERHEKVIYLDPDIMVLNSLSPLADLLDKHDILLTPHQLSPQLDLGSVVHNEICSLQHGVYNLGFVGVARREQGLAFAIWWRDRLYHFCYDDIPGGLFTDQRWCDLAPAFFSKLYIIRDPGYNAASWNLTDRTITRRVDGVFMANDEYLRFYHFTGFDSGAGHAATQAYGKGMPAVSELWTIYEEKLKAFGHEKLGNLTWKYACFPNGEKITDNMRLLYRVRQDLQQTFPNPFDFSKPAWNFLFWYKNQPLKNKSKSEPHIGKILRLSIILGKKYVKSPKLLLTHMSKSWRFFCQSGVRGLSLGIKSFAGASLTKESMQYMPITNQLASMLVAAEKDTNFVLLHFLLAEKNHPVCIIDHQWGGGANDYRIMRIQRYLQAGQAVLLATYNQHNGLVDIEAMYRSKRLCFTVADLRELEDTRFPRLERIIINEVISWMAGYPGHPNSLIGDIPQIVERIIGLSRTHKAAMEMMFHDFFSVCPSLNLLDRNSNFCGIPSDLNDCAVCLKDNPNLCSKLPKNFTINAWREKWKELFIDAEKLVFFSESTRRLVERAYTVHPYQVEVVPHTPLIEYTSPIRIPKEGGMSIAVVGNICKHKGADIVIGVADLLLNDDPTARVVVIGEIEANRIPSNMVVTGKYVREKLRELLEQYHTTVGFMPAICPETFSYVTQELMALGLPLVCFDLGAPAERIGTWEHGLIAPEMNAKSACETLQRLDVRRHVMKMERNAIASTFIKGTGIEVGALHNPLPVPDGVSVKYVDRMDKASLHEQYPELRQHNLVDIDIVDDGEKLLTFADNSQDFIIANHFLEHCEDPIATLKAFFRVLKVGGVIFMALPDKRSTFDKNRERTSLAHLIRDHSEGPITSCNQHFREWAEFVEPHFGRVYTTTEEIDHRACELMTQNYSIHYHVWEPGDVDEMLRYCEEEQKIPLVIKYSISKIDEMIYILKKKET